MKIFSEDVESIKKELELIKDNLIKYNPKRMIDIFEMLEGFASLLYEMSGEEDLEAYEILEKNKKYLALKDKERGLLHKKNIKNFIKNKDMHNMFSSRVVNLYDKKYRYFDAKRLYLKEDQMFEIISDFLNDEFNQADEFKKMVESKRIFKNEINPGEENDFIGVGGYTIYDYINKNSFIVVSSDPKIWDVNMMRILVHEFGHASENMERNSISVNQNARYYWVSSYAEVYSMLYEKLFFDYLIKNNIFRENALKGLKSYYSDIYTNFNNIEYLSTLDDDLLVNERYRRTQELIDQIEVKEDGTIFISSAIFEGFNENKLYSYGGLIASYFAELKHNDIDKYNKYFSNFKTKRFDFFDFKIFEDIGTNMDEIINIYNKGLEDLANNKKLILK